MASLEGSPAWLRFHDSLNGLDDAGKLALRGARRELTERLSDAAVDEHEERLALPRAEFREHTTAEVIDSLAGSAREYADAFTGVQDLLTLVACDIFGELALFGEPWPVSVRNLEAPQPGQPIVAFEAQGATGIFLTTGQVLWLSNDSIADAVRIEAMSMTFDVEGMRERFEAQVLLGTATGWPASTVPLSGSAE